MTKLMLDGGRQEPEDKENRKENRRETWAPGLAGKSIMCGTSADVHLLQLCDADLTAAASHEST